MTIDTILPDRIPESYAFNPRNSPAHPAGMTRQEAEAVAELVRRTRRGRVGCGRLRRIETYQQRTTGRPWSVLVEFHGGVSYECGRTRRIVGRPQLYVGRVQFTDGTTAGAPSIPNQ